MAYLCVGRPSEGTLDVPMTREVYGVVTGSPGHLEQFPYIDQWLEIAQITLLGSGSALLVRDSVRSSWHKVKGRLHGKYRGSHITRGLRGSDFTAATICPNALPPDDGEPHLLVSLNPSISPLPAASLPPQPGSPESVERHLGSVAQALQCRTTGG